MEAALDAGGQEYKVSFDLVTVCPSFVVGPPVGERSDGESVKLIKNMLEGEFHESGVAGGVCIGAVDVRDVAQVHVAAMESPSGPLSLLKDTFMHPCVIHTSIYGCLLSWAKRAAVREYCTSY